jgi:hypothetical protein
MLSKLDPCCSLPTAEPAIAAIRPLAALVDPDCAPYLYYMMNQQQEIMVFAIGLRCPSLAGVRAQCFCSLLLIAACASLP